MLLLIDLDNTLIDRAAAFKAWARTRFGDTEVPWLVEQDRDGYRPKDELAPVIAARYHLEPAEVLVELRAGMVDQLAPDPLVAAALTSCAAAGFVPVVVTNGTVAQQEAKLRRTGLDRLVAGWTISEGAGVRKPDRRIFELAAASVGRHLDEGGWMVGDHAEYDIGGGAAAGLRTGWVSRGQSWPESLDYRPAVTAIDCVGVLAALG
ncbi:HAD family hydrolase [Actinoplanes bogorensis]|uniref:HAD family hydrolase n=1 Tax=Paractinoplanes bogorensis TaxID=1610840 RepID=A0ABS5Z388_9ACTN|nr:HAD family hydrolase [Actinoplanes bogorensis]MBU2670112.1 HAD family hydrolase [Actinoplanes bogorensis]